MARLIFEGLTPEQANQLAHWFEHQGEQYCVEWLEINEVPSPMVDVKQKGCISQIGEDTFVKCYTP